MSEGDQLGHRHGPTPDAGGTAAAEAGGGVARAADWHDKLRAAGHRLTPQRELILTAVDDLGHATPDEVLTEVRRHSAAVNISTVYRTLELLEELGLVRHAHLTDRAPTYHSTRHGRHFHLVCRSCGAIISAEEALLDPLATRLEQELGFTPDVGHLTVFGTCRECR